MKICDRCKEKLDTEKKSSLAGKHFELCTACANYIATHIQNYKNRKNNNFLAKLLNN